jgi:glycosyltransferase involved in cell wall biosynthesis
MLIAIDASRADVPQRTGTEAYSLHVIRGLIAAGGAHRFVLYLRDTPPAELFPPAPNVQLTVIARRRLWTHTALGPAVRRARPDVLFVPSHVVPWPDVGGVPAVVTVHDVGYRRYPQAHPLFERAYLDWSTRHSARTARRVIAVSQATANDLARFDGVSPSKTRVIHSGIDETLKPVHNLAEIVALRDRYGIDGPYVLHVGSLHSRKNLIRLVEAFERVKDEVGGLRLVLAGRPGWGARTIARRITQLGLTGRVILPGYVDQGDLAALYSGARVYAFPSLYEGFGFPALEAMACGTPVVCANSSSLPELTGDAALMFPPEDVAALADALNRALTDDPLRDELIRRGLERAGLFTWRACTDKTLEVLSEAAASLTP